jgi:hypothetical protein
MLIMRLYVRRCYLITIRSKYNGMEKDVYPTIIGKVALELRTNSSYRLSCKSLTTDYATSLLLLNDKVKITSNR